MFDSDHIYHSPQLIHTEHFPNKDGKGSSHSKDPRNCPVVLFYDNTRFKYISFLLRDPIIVMPILNYTITRDDFDQKYKVVKEINEVYLTFRTVVHSFVFNMMENIKKHRKVANIPEPTKPIKPKIRLNVKGTAEHQRRISEIEGRNIEIDMTPAKMSKYPHIYLHAILLDNHLTFTR